MIYVFLANGFEEIEALATVDVLRRCGLDVKLTAVGDDIRVKGAHQMEVTADTHINEIEPATGDALVLPGGMPGSLNLLKCERLRELLVAHNGHNGLIAAICAAPMVLGDLGLLEGRKATCYPSFEKYLHGATPLTEMVVKDGHFITGKGPAAAVDFGCAIAENFVGGQAVTEVRQGMLFE